jgi:hypothetical protein
MVLAFLAAAPGLRAQTAADSAGIRTAALDYAEGWYTGDGDRMARAVHPELVKRILVTDTATGRAFVQTMGASALVNGARHGYGKSTPRQAPAEGRPHSRRIRERGGQRSGHGQMDRLPAAHCGPTGDGRS